MNEEESKISKIIPLRQATFEELTEVITDLHTQNYLKEMEIVRLHSIIKEVREYIEELSEDTEDYIGAIDRRRKVELLEILDKENK